MIIMKAVLKHVLWKGLPGMNNLRPSTISSARAYEIKEIQRRVLEFLYWEGQIDPNYFTVDKIRDETDLTDANVMDGLKLLHENGFVECNIPERGVRILEAKISMMGIDEAKSLLNA